MPDQLSDELSLSDQSPEVGNMPKLFEIESDSGQRSPESRDEAPVFDCISPCPTCSQEFEKMFSEEVLPEKPIGLLKHYTSHSCPFSALVAEAMRLCWGDSWKDSVVNLISRNTHLWLKSKGWVWSVKFKRERRTSYHPRVLLSVDKWPSGVEKTPTSMKQAHGDRFIIAELELLGRNTSLRIASGVPEPPRRSIERTFDCRLAQHWLQMCKNHQHSEEQARDERSQPFWQEPGFRLIDVVDECLVEKTVFCNYVALSYVWGKAAHSCLRTNNSNVAELSKPKALRSDGSTSGKRKNISRSVLDTMEVVRQIGQRYLWVDALCIVQDDESEKRRLIHGMDSIYENATLTVIAATGSDANSGLKGITPRNNLPYETNFKMPGVRGSSFNLALSRPSLVEQVAKSYWNKRAWTYQEHCLSTRCLYFTHDEVFFACKESQWREGYNCEQLELQVVDLYNLEVRTGPPWWGSLVMKDPDPSPFHCLAYRENNTFSWYKMIVQEYSRRHLGNPTDIVNAFQGIFNRFYASPPTDRWLRYAQGVPLHFLPRALLWYPLEGAQRRPNMPVTTNGHFSTWSWASWIGPIDFLFTGTSGLDEVRLARGDGVSVCIEWQFPRRMPFLASEQVHADGAEIVESLFPQELENVMYQKVNDREEDDVSGFSEGILGLWALYLAFTQAPVFSKSPDSNVWTFEISTVFSTIIKGVFRFDEPGNSQEVTELVAIISSEHAITVLGIATSTEGISTRVGIGALFFQRIRWPLRYTESIPKLPWKFRLIRLR